jgi:hypothetical protein
MQIGCGINDLDPQVAASKNHQRKPLSRQEVVSSVAGAGNGLMQCVS